MNTKLAHTDFTISHTHPDLAILCECTNTKPDELRSSFHGGPDAYESNYMKVNFLRYWTPEDSNTLSEQFAEANSKTSEYEFVIDDLTDYEVEWDNDRAWLASFGIKSIKKIVNNL